MIFSEWIDAELERRGWSRVEAAKRGNISASMIDKVVNEYSEPGIKFLKGIALAFNMTLFQVIQKLDNPDRVDEVDTWAEEMEHKMTLVPPHLRPFAENMLEALIKNEEQAEAAKLSKLQPKRSTK